MNFKYEYKRKKVIPDDFVFARIGMALLSAQRVEFLTKSLVTYLAAFDTDLYGLTTSEFLEDSKKASKVRTQTLGFVFKRLKLNPTLVLADELDEYLSMRNILVHQFWLKYLRKKSQQESESAVEFCNKFGAYSKKIESFYKGFLYLLQQRNCHKLNRPIDSDIAGWKSDYEYFIIALGRPTFFENQ